MEAGQTYPFQSVPGVVDGGREGMLGRETVVDADGDGAVFLHGVDAAIPQKPSARTPLLQTGATPKKKNKKKNKESAAQPTN